MIDWAHAGTPIVASFLASLVEFVEALTIVLAVGTVRGWRPAIAGAIGGAAFLTVVVALFGPAVGRVPLHYLQMVIGTLLLFFGLRWLRKAVLRTAGVLTMHDEEAIYRRETAALRSGGTAEHAKTDWVAVAATFKAVLLEGLEVVFIVLATGAVGHMLVPASLGAAAAGVVVIGCGIAVHRPLARVPENALKWAVGLLLSAFGAFWLGEGLGYRWPGEDLAVPGLVAMLLAASWVGVALASQARGAAAGASSSAGAAG